MAKDVQYVCDKHPWYFYADGEDCPACGDNFEGFVALVDQALAED